MNNNGYIAIEINGEQIGLKFGLPCVTRLEEKSSVMKEKGMWAAYLLYYGYLNNCLIKEVEPTKNLEFFTDYTDASIVDEKTNAELLKVIECFNESKLIKGLKEKNKPEEKVEAKKKNRTQKK